MGACDVVSFGMRLYSLSKAAVEIIALVSLLGEFRYGCGMTTPAAPGPIAPGPTGRPGAHTHGENK